MEKRNSGLDLFRLLCCIGVLNAHVVDDLILRNSGERSMISLIFYYGSCFCIPAFFLLSGYLAASRDSFSMDYAEKKIFVCMGKLLGWNLLWTMVHFFRTGEFYDVPGMFFEGAAAGGILPISWFLFTYCMIMILAYPLFRIYKKYPRFFDIAALLWMILLAAGVGDGIRAEKAQVLWLHLYTGYFVWGMALNHLLRIYDREKKKINLIAAAGALLSFAVYTYYWKKFGGWPDHYYGKWYYTLFVSCLAVFVFTLEINKPAVKVILKRLSENTFVVYMAHLPMLTYFSAKYPVGKFSTVLIYVFLLFSASQLLAELFRRLPMLRRLV